MPVGSEQLGLSRLPESLSKYECHTSLAIELTGSCKGDQTSGMTETEKQSLAISLTLCSIQSALQPVPRECDPWLPQVSPSHFEKASASTERTTGQRNVQPCLSMQDWNSYNIYLSDATQLCHALEAKKQAALDRSRFVKVANEQLHLLETLRVREERQLARDQSMAEGFARQEENQRETASAVKQAVHSLNEELHATQALSVEISAAFSALESRSRLAWEDIEAELRARNRDALDHFEKVAEHWIAEWSRRNEVVLSQQSAAVQGTVGVWLVDLQQEMNSFVRTVQEDMTHLDQAWNASLYMMQQGNTKQLGAMGDRVELIHAMINTTIGTTRELSTAQGILTGSLERSISHVNQLEEVQGRLVDVLNKTLHQVEGRGARRFSFPQVALFSVTLESRDSWPSVAGS
ncbi:hypothetical protein IAU60_001829 [Kwoniella sp. DSM 27419]